MAKKYQLRKPASVSPTNTFYSRNEAYIIPDESEEEDLIDVVKLMSHDTYDSAPDCTDYLFSKEEQGRKLFNSQ